jgi:hypothetical protein
LFLGLIALAVLTSCARRQTPPDDAARYQEQFLRDKADYEPNLGKNYWALMNMAACPVPTLIEDGKCEGVPKGSKFQPVAIEQGPAGAAYYHVKL